ncbi:MAG: alpha/beta hydrolase-fold protein [Lepagella sp.]
MKRLFIFLLPLLSLLSAGAVTFNVTVPDGTKQCYVTGAFNTWSADGALLMQKSSANTFTLTLDNVSASDLASGFKYLCGPSWSYVEKAADGSEISNRTVATDNDVVGSWASLYDPSIISTSLEINGYNRRVRIHLPSDYESATDKYYPVLIYTGVQQRYNNAGSDDAGDDFFGDKSWNASATAELLESQGKTPCIMVEVYGFVAENIPYHVDDFAGSGDAENFINELNSKLLTYLYNNYRCKMGAENLIIMGADLGGLLSVYATLSRPDLFARCIAMSPLLYLNQQELLDLIAQKNISEKFFFSYGTAEPAVISDNVDAVVAAINDRNPGAALQLTCINATHDDDSWGEFFPNLYLFATGDNANTGGGSVKIFGSHPAETPAAAPAKAQIANSQYALFNAIDSQDLQLDSSVSFVLHNDFELSDGSTVNAVIAVKDIPVDVKTKYYWNVGRLLDSGEYDMLLDSPKNVGFSSKKSAVSWHRVVIRDDESVENVAVSSAAFALNTASEKYTMVVSGDHLVSTTASFLGEDKSFVIHYGSVNSGSDMGAITGSLSVSADCTEAQITYDFVTNHVDIVETKHGSAISADVIKKLSAVPAIASVGKSSIITLSIDPQADVTPSASMHFNNDAATPIALTPSASPGVYTFTLPLAEQGRYTVSIALSSGETVMNDAAQIAVVAKANSGEVDQAVIVANAYENVDWNTVGRYKANFHTHTSQSFDTEFATHIVVDRYCNADYKILALTDHDANSYPWNYFDLYNPAAEVRDPEQLGMLAIPGVELSKDNRNTWDEASGGSFNHHNDFFTGRKGQEFASLRESYAYTNAIGGMQIINHPGQYWNIDTDYAPGVKNSPEWHAENFQLYPSLIGFEVYNQGNRRPNDRILWDQVLSITMPSRPVWGYSCDDTHTLEQYFRNYQYMLMPNLTVDDLKEAMRAGAQYFCYEPDGSGRAKAPHIDSITVDDVAHTISIDSPDAKAIYWICGTHLPGSTPSSRRSTVVGMGPDFDFTGYEGSYVRALIVNDFGETCTQPFGFATSDPSDIDKTANLSDTPKFSLFPNPANDTVSFSAPDIISRVSIHDTEGKLMIRSTGNNSQRFELNVASLPEGIYLATIATPTKAETLKLIKR